MSSEILLNGKQYHFGESDLPALFTYGEGVGGSHFSVTAVADMFLRGSKILFLTAYPMAKDNFMEQISDKKDKVIYADDKCEINDNQAIIVESGNETIFLEYIEKLKDLDERVVFIKNIETFSDVVLERCLSLERVVLSGDIDKCVGGGKIISKRFKTVVAFNEPKTEFPFEVPGLERYSGYLVGENYSGTVKVKM